MRVLVLTNSFPSPREPDQGPFMLRRLAVLRERGCEFQVAAPIPRMPWPAGLLPAYREMAASVRAAPAEEDYGGFRVHHPRYWKLPGALDFGAFGPLYWRGVRGLVRRLHREPGFDLIHAMSLVPDGYAAARLGRELGVPAVATERGYINRCPASARWRSIYAQTIGALDAVAAVSRAIADRVAALGTPRSPVKVVYTGVDSGVFAPADTAAARRKLGLPEGPLVMCLARIEAIKQPLLVLRAFAQAARNRGDISFAWVGEGAEKPALEAAAREAGLQSRVFLPGKVAHEDVPAWLAAAVVVVLASSSEGLPNSLVEASACARPIVATRTDGVPEVVLDGETGLLVPKGDAAALAAAIGRLLDDPELGRRMGEAGRRHVLGRFSWKKHADEMMNVYESALSGQPGR